jgi:hypothetical protein
MDTELEALMRAIEQITLDNLAVTDSQLYKEFNSGDTIQDRMSIKNAAYQLEYEGKLLVLDTKEGGFILKAKHNTEH